MKLIKLVSIISIFCIFVSTMFSNSEVVGATSNDSPVKFTILEQTETYTKVKVEDFKNGTVEYVESFYENGEYVYNILTREDKVLHTFEKNGEEILVDGKVLETSTEYGPKNVLQKDIVSLGGYTTQAIKWKYSGVLYSSNTAKYATASYLASMIGLLLGLPVWAAAVQTTVSHFVLLDLKTVYWKRLFYRDANATYSTCKTADITHVYKWSNYTGYVSDSGLLVDSVDQCSSGY
jgi:predicted small integral membrane protein